MGDLTKNFSRSEFICKCEYEDCRHKSADFELVSELQAGVDHFESVYNQKVSCKVTSGNRCRKHNEVIGGAPDSSHVWCIASDVKFFLPESNEQINPDEVADYYESKHPDKFGIGRYSNRTHMDVRPIKARWDSRKEAS